MNKNFNYEIWSIIPPPYGGISIHSYRLFKYLKDSKKINVSFVEIIPPKHLFDFKYVFFTLVNLFKKRQNFVFHFHQQNLFFWLFIIILPFNLQYFVTIHNKDLLDKQSFFINLVVRKYLKNAKCTFINDQAYGNDLINKFNLKDVNWNVIEAYITPHISEYSVLPNDILLFKNKFKILISGNAYKLMFDKNKIDLYGLDMAIDLIYNLKKNGYNVGLIFLIPLIEDANYYNLLKKKILDLDLKNSILLYTCSLSNAFQLWEISDVFIRPTTTDIEAISVKEALSFGIPVVTSDVCVRPEGVFLFKNRDFDDFYNQVINAINRGKNNSSFKSIKIVTEIENQLINR